MNNKINIIQFMPYFPPHKWWVETVWEEIGKYWVKNNFWEFINVVTEFEQNPLSISPQGREVEQVIFNWEVIWYKKGWYEVLVCPSIEIINNFPVYKFWDKKYWIIMQYLNEKIWENKNNFRVLTHTRFFLTSFIWWIFARKNNIKWIHIEHWSSYVKLSSKLKSYLSIVYDKSFGKWIFKKADKVLAISEACKTFINKEFVDREVDIFYRGIDLSDININKTWDIKFIFIWRLVNLKWVSDLVEAYKKSWLKNGLIIIWDWEEKEKLESISKWFNITFLWFRNRDFIIDFLSKNHLILINPSYQEWMPTTVIEALSTWTLVIASDVWGTPEISNNGDLILFEAWNKSELGEKLKYSLVNYKKLNWLSLRLINERFNRENNISNLYDLVK